MSRISWNMAECLDVSGSILIRFQISHIDLAMPPSGGSSAFGFEGSLYQMVQPYPQDLSPAMPMKKAGSTSGSAAREARVKRASISFAWQCSSTRDRSRILGNTL